MVGSERIGDGAAEFGVIFGVLMLDQAKVIVAARSNNEMDATKLNKEFPELLDIKSSLIKYVFEPNSKVKK